MSPSQRGEESDDDLDVSETDTKFGDKKTLRLRIKSRPTMLHPAEMEKRKRYKIHDPGIL
jgi:hypothetical protein